MLSRDSGDHSNEQLPFDFIFLIHSLGFFLNNPTISFQKNPKKGIKTITSAFFQGCYTIRNISYESGK
jgi:hypothetical protein